jgi:hypothetical protein
MNKQDDFNGDLPDMTDEIMNEFKAIKPVDLHLGPPEVKRIDRNAWINEFGPKPPGPEIIALDVLTVVLGCMLLYFVFMSWVYAFS